MIGSYSGVVLVLFGLNVFGWLYNWSVGKFRRSGWLEPYISLWVAGGSFVTILGMGVMDYFFVNWNAFFIALLCFTASGSPMIAGSFKRYIEAQQSDKAELRKVLSHDPSQTLADKR